MKILLDTHVLIWAANEPSRLKNSTLTKLKDKQNSLFVSSVSSAEIEIKRALNKIRLDGQCSDLARHIDAQLINLTHKHCEHLKEIPMLHKDPFDRLLISQALSEEMTICTGDKTIKKYDIKILEA